MRALVQNVSKIIMKKKNTTLSTLSLYCLSFLIPAVIILAALAGLKITPFGDHTLVISDGNGLYINYLGYVGRFVKGQEGFLYSFEKGLGGNMMGSWGWFLLNPFFALFAFFDIAAYPAAYTWVSLLNFSACGVTMYILLKDVYGHGAGRLIFSTAYALCGFLVANVFQMNFFTGVMALPLVVLGLRRILGDGNPLLYVLSLAYSLLTNFYFGFMLCVASVLLFAVIFITELRGLNKNAVLIKYTLSSLLAGMLSCVIWLPAVLSLRGGRLDQSVAYAVSFQENMPFLEMASKLFTGANSTAELSNGLPNIFVGILPVALCILFFLNKGIERRRKIAAGVLLGFYLITFYIPAFNLVMHGGTVTNWFNYRDSFVFSFLLLMLAAEAWSRIDDSTESDMKRTAVGLGLAALVVFFKRYEYVTGGAMLLDFALLALMYLALRMHRKNPEKNPKRTLAMVLLVLTGFNLFMNYRICTKNIQEWETTETEYQEVVMPVSILVEAVKNTYDDFYRMEIGEQRSGNSGNDPMLYGYYGVGHGGSDDRNFVRTALSELGIHRFDMRNSYGKGVTAATDTLLGLRFIISKEDLTEEKGYERLVTLGEWAAFRNPDALSVAMLSDAEIADTEIDLENIFDNLNRVWQDLTGETDLIFTEETDIQFSSYNITDPLTLTQGEAAEIVAARDAALLPAEEDEESESPESSAAEITQGSYKEPVDNVNYIKYTWTASRDGAVYSYNRSGMTEQQGSNLPSLFYEGYYHAGDTITGYLPVTGSMVTKYLLEDVAGRFRAAYADADALAEMSAIVNARPCTVEKVKENKLRGTFTAEEGQLLLFTIPYDEGWTLTVDGQKTEYQKVLDVFMAAETQPGEHTYEITFIPTGLRAGGTASAAAILALAVYIPLDSRRRRRAHPQQDQPASA